MNAIVCNNNSRSDVKLGKVIWEGFFYYGCVEWQHTLQEIMTYILRGKKQTI